MIVNVDEEIKKQLQYENFSSRFLDNCFNSKFLAIERENKKILGVGFLGGVVNSYGIEILEEFRGKGIGKKILNEIIFESKKNSFSFISGVFKPTNTNSVKMHLKVGFVPLFVFFYNEKEGAEIPTILPLNKKGLFLVKLFQIFDTKIGNFCFGLILKIVKPFSKELFAFSNSKMPNLDLKYSMKKFENVKTILKKYNTI